MGAAGKKREEELLSQIAALEKVVREKETTIGNCEAEIATLKEQIRMKEDEIKEL